jgi:hypothetical protein
LEQPLFEEAAAIEAQEGEAKENEPKEAENLKQAEKPKEVEQPTEAETKAALRRAETIRVYADNDVYALLADVENTITRMGSGDLAAKDLVESLPDAERRNLCRTRSHDVLSGSPARKPLPISKLAEKPSSSSLSSFSTPTSSTPEPPPEEIFLTNAVFKP